MRYLIALQSVLLATSLTLHLPCQPPAAAQDTQKSPQEREKDAIDVLFSPSQQKACGLGRLEREERKNLEAAIVRIRQSEDLYMSAYAYLEEQGFKPVTVHGTRKLKLEGESIAQEYLIVEDRRGTKWACEDVFTVFLPGKYWADMHTFGPTKIIDRNGSERRIFTAHEFP